MINAQGLIEIPLSVFSGLNEELGPTDVPSGLSPENSDVAFLPGSFFTRPPLKRASTLSTTAQIVYEASYIKPDGTSSQFQADSLGGLYFDGVKVGQTQAGNRFHAVNSFGKMQIAISDGLHGADVPLQFDGQYLDRISQDAPGGPATLANYALPAVSLVAGTTGTPVAISSITPINPVTVQVGGGESDYPYGGGYRPPTYQTYYSALQVTTSSAHGLIAGQSFSISGNTLYNTSGTVSSVSSTTVFQIPGYYQTNTTGTGGSVTPSAPFLQRSGNQVTASTASAHGLRVGYLVKIGGVPDASTNISSLVINNETAPGLATITVAQNHGFVAGETISILNVQPANVGGGINTFSVNSGTATVVTNTPHGLQVGSQVLVQLSGGVLAPWTVNAVPSATSFTFTGITGSPSGTGGVVQLQWPLASGTEVTISSIPSLNSFTFPITFSDGTWNTGTISFAWNGSFYVTSVSSATTFAYRQNGPDALIQAGSGTVTPVGQIAAGQRSAVVIFQTRSGYVTGPSITFTVGASGLQYLLCSNVPIGPANVVARIIAFTGANGGRYFYLPVAPKDPSGGFIIGTATVIPDNTTTSAIFDFTDQSLFSGIAIDIPGNNLFNQVVLGPCLSFFAYASRLIPWGERNKVQQFFNMGFEGGTYSGAPNVPLGWTVTGTGTLVAGIYGKAWQTTTGTLAQTAYQDRFGIAIIQPNTLYSIRGYFSGTGSVRMQFVSASAGVLATGTIAVTNGYGTSVMSTKTPAVMPSDTQMVWSVVGGTATFDELEVFYAANPYILYARASYVNNPEAFDAVTGILGPANDPHAVFGMEERKDVLCFLTEGPNGSLYEVEDTASGEPVTWNVRHIASKCGLISSWGISKFEDWFIWTSDTGVRIYNGGDVEKLSQEIQPWWDTFNPAAKQFTVLSNDPYLRRIYVLACINSAIAPDETYVLDYRELNTANLLANSGTLRVGYTGKVVTTDLTRKWSQWSVTANYCSIVYPNGADPYLSFCGGAGNLTTALYSATYSLLEGSLIGIDDDYGPFWDNFAYSTYFFVSADEAEQKQLGTHRLLHQFMSLNVTGLGAVVVTPQLDRLQNFGRPSRALALSPDLARDIEIGLNVSAERISYRVTIQPQSGGTQAGLILSQMTLGVTTNPWSPVRGRNG